MKHQVLLLLFIVLSVIYFLANESTDLIENWATSPGTLMQLATSRPLYLTGEIVHPGYYHHHKILPYYQFDHDYRNYPVGHPAYTRS